MSTFIGQLVGFAVIVWIIGKYVVPPVRKMMADQRQAVATQLEESAKATQRLAAADQHHAARVAEGKADAQHVVSEARADSVRIGEALRAQADVEAERIVAQGGQQSSLLRAQMVRQLRGELGGAAVSRARELVSAYVSDPAAQSSTVDRFLDELESMAPADSAPDVDSSDMRSASRDALAAVVGRFDSISGSLSVDELSTTADDLAAVAKLLVREPILARHLAEASGETEAKKQLLQRVLGGKVGASTLDVLDTAASVRWSSTSDFVDSVEELARLSLLVRAERENQAEEVAEQLFRFGRLLNAEPQLNTLLGDYSKPAEARVALLRDVLGKAGGGNATAGALLAQTVELLRGDRADDAVTELAQLAIARRGEVVAEVGAAAELTDAQRTRLTAVLTRIYHHPVSVQLHVDPALLGGLSVAVADEVIDGTLSSRLSAAETKLPD
ncbi:MAG TPA: F0F1 ATP synthase subunit B/delta [Mycobacterium sp.]|uniref:F0F1 ATP synthase subunit B/delta n=1 Tax=Mycolicibacterium sp. TaxID=2320850 RepID=UPI0025F41436|nr:F0F1 ATP synthase subunit B/delta [Mycolicibacterium sp.]HPX38147.1 F0F1 ATP synthase subunit B/delta [Mycobacterium sp.]HQC75904.1 F0F1 ATP synthase subunit B/delta [Mycobacterium sp.]